MITPALAVPAGGGALGFRLWMETAHDLLHPGLSWNGMILETKRAANLTWSYHREATYNVDQRYFSCKFYNHDFPFGSDEVADMFSGDGSGTAIGGDTFDREQLADLSALAGDTVQVRFRFGADNPSQYGPIGGERGPRTGAWLDTITQYGPWASDAWPGAAPTQLQGDPASCPDSFGLSWDSVAGAGGYNIYRSEISCADASAMAPAYDSTGTTSYVDSSISSEVSYFYAVEATEAGRGCPTERACIPGCPCLAPDDATHLRLDRQGPDVLMTWDDPGSSGITWNVYRDGNPDPATWGVPHATGVVDEDAVTPGVQHTDAGASSSYFYLVTAVGACGESPLR